ncbi:Ig-like domain-containing protein [Micromonospora sp. DT178]|uniref:Ig-like domain-containing protein n=1 Tax=Micromonospora sp. DT178 TaxID=3393436 RepID=UPI003CFA43E7
MLDDHLRTVAFRTTTSLEVDTTSAGSSHRTHVTATAEVDPVTVSNRAPSGTVDFYAGAKYLGSAPVRDGIAQFEGTVSDDLDQPVTARYQGDSLYNASESAAVNAG